VYAELLVRIIVDGKVMTIIPVKEARFESTIEKSYTVVVLIVVCSGVTLKLRRDLPTVKSD